MMKLDLKDAYFSIPLAVEHRRYLRFIFNNLVYEFQCLPFDSTNDVYEGPETCDCFVETTRATSDYIPRRSAVVAFRSQGTREIISRSVSTADRSRVSYKEGEMLDSSSAIPCFSWCSDQLVDHDLGSTSDKVTRVTVRSTSLEKEENMCNKGTVGPSRENDSNVQDRGEICTPSLQELTKTAHQVDSQVRNISSETTDYTHAGSHGRLGMVDINEATGGEFSTDNGTDPQHHNPNRRIPAWLGGSLSRGKDGESLEHKRTRSSHQRPRV